MYNQLTGRPAKITSEVLGLTMVFLLIAIADIVVLAVFSLYPSLQFYGNIVDHVVVVSIAITAMVKRGILPSITRTQLTSMVPLLGISAVCFVTVGLVKGIEIEPSLGGFLVVVQNIIVYFVIVAFMEELVFRGDLMTRLKSILGSKRGLRNISGMAISSVISALVFALFHLSPNRYEIAFIGGLVYAFSYAISDNILAPTFIHGFYDLAIVLFFNSTGLSLILILFLLLPLLTCVVIYRENLQRDRRNLGMLEQKLAHR